jgi:Putative Na+/H+ antiporter
MNPTAFEILATVLFALAVLHTFMIKGFHHLATQCRPGSVQANLFHLLGEIEIVFGIWAGFLLVSVFLLEGKLKAIHYLESLNFTEPIFVFAIMAVAATRPVLQFASALIDFVSRLVFLPGRVAFYLVSLIIGPVLGSFITEPASMTVTALLLRDRYFTPAASDRFRYVTLAVLFVNVSIGGTLTSFAAPPILMVASPWQWDFGFMISHFGWKALAAVIINAGLASAFLYKEIKTSAPDPSETAVQPSPRWLSALHLLALAAIATVMHHPVVFMGVFLYFLGLTVVTRQYQDELQLKSSLMVAFFLAGLVVLGGPQRWWLEPLISRMTPLPLFLGTTFLTAFTDNAALTYLGAQLPNVSDAFKYALVAGAVSGGGLTVIANAPNPAGFSILQQKFGPEGISPMGLFKAAVVPTLIAMASFWLL